MDFGFKQTPLQLLIILHLENTTILDVAYVAANSTTSATSAIRAEAWLPDEWYGRFLGLGNGGLGGCIFYSELDYGSMMHFATVGSNNGHDGNGGLPFLGNPDVINDFAFRSIHTEAVIGKQIVEVYYGRPHEKAYYLGCSTGGRQGTQTALKYPDDFDGIIAGAPATNFNRLLHWMGMMARAIGAPHPESSPTFIPPELWNLVAAEVLAQCDAIDGVRDGIITEPDVCDFQPEVLVCQGGSTEGCLMPAQVEVLHKIYAPLYDGSELIYSRLDPGSEGSNLGGPKTFEGGFPNLTQEWFKYAVRNVTDFDFSKYGPREGRLMDAVNPGGISTFEGNMSAFRDRGGKFLTYHGRMDSIIPSGNSKRMYDLVAHTLGMSSLDNFYRLFLVPGMGHCLGGPGAAALGQLGGAYLVNASSHNLLLALVDWVESGDERAPETITGTTDDGKERVHCRYRSGAFGMGRNSGVTFDEVT
ncbi:tannase and feruloyl esterase [Mycena galericulata]|nr:tannase and feruloyl esterase [Mycena galericulata]